MKDYQKIIGVCQRWNELPAKEGAHSTGRIQTEANGYQTTKVRKGFPYWVERQSRANRTLSTLGPSGRAVCVLVQKSEWKERDAGL